MARIYCIRFFILISFLVAASVEGFDSNEVYESIEKMLAYHVEYKQFSPLLAKRSVKLFMDQFDPHRIYLLEGESSLFLHRGEGVFQSISSDHQRKNYQAYVQINQVIEKAILRSREIRAKVQQELIHDESFSFEGEEGDPSAFSKDEKSLEQKIRQQWISLLLFEQEQEGLLFLSEEDRKKCMDLWEKRFRRSEESYFSHADGLSMHILKAFAKSLDAHTSFFSPQEAYDLRMSLEKQFEGIGIVLREGIRGVYIKEVLVKSPADRSGKVHPGDVLFAIDHQQTASLSYDEILSRLKGEKGKKISLTLQRGEDLFTVTLVRDKIIMEEDLLQFSYTPYGKGMIGLITLPSFYESSDGSSCEKDLREAVRKLRAKGDLLGLIIDMRNNSGGFLNQAVKVASLFISSGVVVVSKYADGQMQYLRGVDGRSFYSGPLILLTSKASASATEIVAQSLQDYGIALVVGDERTYGKGTIQYQTVTEDGASSFFKVTVGRYYTASGKSTQIQGVRADIFVPSEYALLNIGEKYLPYALKNDQIPPVFQDPLLDVDPKKKEWLQKNYLPNLQKQMSCWTEMLPVLKANSQYRLDNDKNFLCFLKELQGQEDEEISLMNFGEEDLQRGEAVQILKDMLLLQKHTGK